ncbi:MAG: peptide deformylase [Erysipelotrichaceae bacterium]
MIKPIIKDIEFLKIKASTVSEEDLYLIDDLKDTLKEHCDGCVGLAANMIGVSKAIIIVDIEGEYLIMVNPIIIKESEGYNTEEGCLSLEGKRSTKRYNYIKVKYKNEKMQDRVKSYKGFSAQIIQHEIDHLNGIII